MDGWEDACVAGQAVAYVCRHGWLVGVLVAEVAWGWVGRWVMRLGPGEWVPAGGRATAQAVGCYSSWTA